MGVAQSGLANAPSAPSISPSDVTEQLATRLAEDRVFRDVIHPDTALAKVRVDVLFDVVVRVEEDAHWGEDIFKAMLTGLTFLRLGPLLPSHFTVVVELTANVDGAGGTEVDRDRYRSEYDDHSTTMTPSGEKMEEFLSTAKRHAVEDVLLQIQRDRPRFMALVDGEAG
ncbi:MAG: hypothetical protein R3F35_15610 [Myxococcota bacterium]